MNRNSKEVQELSSCIAEHVVQKDERNKSYDWTLQPILTINTRDLTTSTPVLKSKKLSLRLKKSTHSQPKILEVSKKSQEQVSILTHSLKNSISF